MKANLIATLAAAALVIPAAGYAAGTDAPKDRPSSASPSPSTGASPSTAPQKDTGPVSDAVITTKVKAEFAKDKAVSAMRINVDTDKGVVTLGGTAKSKAEAEKAVTLAKNVSGVATVKNEIKVEMN